MFLNCCHLGRADALPRGTGRLASSIARELINMGVRCVVAAGWEVDDGAASLFARTFYESLIGGGMAFAEAVTEARRQVWQQRRQCNTWGAYQAYGDPAFKLAPGAGATGATACGYRRSSCRRGSMPWRWMPAPPCAVGTEKAPDRRPRTGSNQGDVARDPGFPRPNFLSRPEIQAALGRLYGELGGIKIRQWRPMTPRLTWMIPPAICPFGSSSKSPISRRVRAIEPGTPL